MCVLVLVVSAPRISVRTHPSSRLLRPSVARARGSSRTHSGESARREWVSKKGRRLPTRGGESRRRDEGVGCERAAASGRGPRVVMVVVLVPAAGLGVLGALLLVELALLLDGGVLVLLVLGHEIVHVGLGLGELHLVHALTGVPVEERLAAEHGGELLGHALEHLL